MNKKIVIIFLGVFLSVLSLSLADEQKTVPVDTKIILERTVCYGACPAYRLTVDADGKVKFIGKEFVKAPGEHLKIISQEKVLQILTELGNINFFELNGKYDCYDWTDSPTATITATTNGRTKQIVHYHDLPPKKWTQRRDGFSIKTSSKSGGVQCKMNKGKSEDLTENLKYQQSRWSQRAVIKRPRWLEALELMSTGFICGKSNLAIKETRLFPARVI